MVPLRPSCRDPVAHSAEDDWSRRPASNP